MSIQDQILLVLLNEAKKSADPNFVTRVTRLDEQLRESLFAPSPAPAAPTSATK